MGEKRFSWDGDILFDNLELRELGNCLEARDIADLLNKLYEKNEKLRQTIKEVQELLTEEVDLFSDKATEHDIIAYKEMNDFDNKDAYYMCVSTKKAIKMLQKCL